MYDYTTHAGRLESTTSPAPARATRRCASYSGARSPRTATGAAGLPRAAQERGLNDYFQIAKRDALAASPRGGARAQQASPRPRGRKGVRVRA